MRSFVSCHCPNQCYCQWGRRPYTQQYSPFHRRQKNVLSDGLRTCCSRFGTKFSASKSILEKIRTMLLLLQTWTERPQGQHRNIANRPTARRRKTMQTLHRNPKQGERQSRSEEQQIQRRRLRHLFTRTKHLQPTAQTVQEGPSQWRRKQSQEAHDEESGRKRPSVGAHVFPKEIASNDLLDL